MWTIRIPRKPDTWNIVVRKHYRVVKNIFDAWKEATYYSSLNAPKKPRWRFPVSIIVTARWKSRRKHDVDGILFKPVLDQLVTQGILPDDDLAYVGSVTYRGERGCDKDELVISITSARRKERGTQAPAQSDSV